MAFYDESGIPYYASTGVMSYQNCEGICHNGR